MLIGICTLQVFLYETNSLKEKRQIIKSVIERVKSRYNVSIAEVGEQDKWNIAKIGFCCVSNTRRHADEMLNNVIQFIERDGRFDVTKCEVEII